MEQTCNVENCARVAWSKGFCRSHYHQQWQGRPFTDLPAVAYEYCKVTDCFNVAQTKGYCRTHAATAHKFNKVDAKRLDQLLTQPYCDLCGITRDAGFAIDHDHRHCPANSGCEECIRGVLCRYCNTAMSRVDDDNWLNRAVLYKTINSRAD